MNENKFVSYVGGRTSGRIYKSLIDAKKVADEGNAVLYLTRMNKESINMFKEKYRLPDNIIFSSCVESEQSEYNYFDKVFCQIDKSELNFWNEIYVVDLSDNGVDIDYLEFELEKLYVHGDFSEIYSDLTGTHKADAVESKYIEKEKLIELLDVIRGKIKKKRAVIKNT